MKTLLILQTLLKEKKDEIGLGLFFELAEEDKLVCNQIPVNKLIEGLEKRKMAFLRKVFML